MSIFYRITSSFHFHILKLFTLRGLRKYDQEGKKLVYLTFDDGPDTGITEFVLENLLQAKAHGTFFCLGKCCEENQDLFQQIIKNGHTVGSHTYSHVNGHTMKQSDYVEEVEKAARIINSVVFRPPWGAIRFKTYFNLRKKGYKIYLWNASSSDADYDNFNLENAYAELIKTTKPGAVVLFHFSNELEPFTRQILPVYLTWLQREGYRCVGL